MGQVVAGASGRLLVRDGMRGTILVDAAKGSRLAELKLPTGQQVDLFPNTWLVGRRHSVMVAWFSYDSCGTFLRELPKTRIERRFTVTDSRDDAVEVAWSSDDQGRQLGNTEWQTWNGVGEKILGPKPAEGLPVAAGADGTIFSFKCPDPLMAPTSSDAAELVAYDGATLAVSWKLSIGGACPQGNVALDERGVLYLSHIDANGGSEVVAVQTRSPGLADSSWPSWRRDNSGSA